MTKSDERPHSPIAIGPIELQPFGTAEFTINDLRAHGHCIMINRVGADPAQAVKISVTEEGVFLNDRSLLETDQVWGLFCGNASAQDDYSMKLPELTHGVSAS